MARSDPRPRRASHHSRRLCQGHGRLDAPVARQARQRSHWAVTVGPNTKLLAEAILRDRSHPEQGYRSALGILRLSNKHGKDRLELACAKAFAIRSPSYKTVKTMLEQRMEGAPLRSDARSREHKVELSDSLGADNVRGGGYYH